MTTAVPPAERGALRISGRAFASIAAQAAREALSAGRASASAERRRGPDLRVALELPYPDDLRAISARVRQRVDERVRELTDVQPHRVLVVIETLR